LNENIFNHIIINMINNNLIILYIVIAHHFRNNFSIYLTDIFMHFMVDVWNTSFSYFDIYFILYEITDRE